MSQGAKKKKPDEGEEARAKSGEDFSENPQQSESSIPSHSEHGWNTHEGTLISTKSMDINTNRSFGEASIPVIQIIRGPGTGTLKLFNPVQVFRVGRQLDCELHLNEPSVSRHHAEFYFQDDQLMVRDLNSTNGTFVDGKVIHQPTALVPNSRISIGKECVLRYAKLPDDEVENQLDLYRKAVTDALTGAHNRRHFQDAFQRDFAHCKRHGKSDLAIAVFDVDHFKIINDRYGHPAGDEVLREIAQRAQNLVRREDLFARIGGEEFAVISREADPKALQALCDRIREGMRNKPVVFENQIIPFTVSVGATIVEPHKDPTPEASFQRADDALYEAKHAGRDRVIIR